MHTHSTLLQKTKFTATAHGTWVKNREGSSGSCGGSLCCCSQRCRRRRGRLGCLHWAALVVRTAIVRAATTLAPVLEPGPVVHVAGKPRRTLPSPTATCAELKAVSMKITANGLTARPEPQEVLRGRRRLNMQGHGPRLPRHGWFGQRDDWGRPHADAAGELDQLSRKKDASRWRGPI